MGFARRWAALCGRAAWASQQAILSTIALAGLFAAGFVLVANFNGVIAQVVLG